MSVFLETILLDAFLQQQFYFYFFCTIQQQQYILGTFLCIFQYIIFIFIFKLDFNILKTLIIKIPELKYNLYVKNT